MQNFINVFKSLFTVLNFFVYFFLLACLVIYAIDKTMLPNLDLQWWSAFLILEVWFNAVIMRKKELPSQDKE